MDFLLKIRAEKRFAVRIDILCKWTCSCNEELTLELTSNETTHAHRSLLEWGKGRVCRWTSCLFMMWDIILRQSISILLWSYSSFPLLSSSLHGSERAWDSRFAFNALQTKSSHSVEECDKFRASISRVGSTHKSSCITDQAKTSNRLPVNRQSTKLLLYLPEPIKSVESVGTIIDNDPSVVTVHCQLKLNRAISCGIPRKSETREFFLRKNSVVLTPNSYHWGKLYNLYLVMSINSSGDVEVDTFRS